MRALAVAAVFAAFSSVASAQEWRNELKSDVVVVRAGKMIIEEVGLYKLGVAGYQPSQVQVKIHSEAPVGGAIGRDNFVSLTTLTFTTVFLTALAEAYRVPASQFLEGVDYTELTNPIGTPDLELNLVMTNEGMQLEVVNTASGERTRHTMTWAEVFAK